jgi:hypothetical protein
LKNKKRTINFAKKYDREKEAPDYKSRGARCTVHVVGMIFVRIGVMRIIDDRN